MSAKLAIGSPYKYTPVPPTLCRRSQMAQGRQVLFISGHLCTLDSIALPHKATGDDERKQLLCRVASCRLTMTALPECGALRLRAQVSNPTVNTRVSARSKSLAQRIAYRGPLRSLAADLSGHVDMTWRLSEDDRSPKEPETIYTLSGQERVLFAGKTTHISPLTV
jgi:hypothetical protein